ncbi:MAG: hypothetical protein DKT66_19840 [Candidatus Melainabacteria bacterium]|nr:MAG: hypothetical protein DKT66_19840 [Candidatus Melainabacteria bacterium]
MAQKRGWRNNSGPSGIFWRRKASTHQNLSDSQMHYLFITKNTGASIGPETMKQVTMKNPAAVPIFLLAIAMGALFFLLEVWPGLPSSTIETQTHGTLNAK